MRRIGIIMHGVTGRMGLNQLLIRSVCAIRAEGVRARYGRQEVLHGLDFGVPTGGSLGIVGESGSGKTPLARMIARTLTTEP